MNIQQIYHDKITSFKAKLEISLFHFFKGITLVPISYEHTSIAFIIGMLSIEEY